MNKIMDLIPENTAGMRELTSIYLGEIMKNHYPLFVTGGKLNVLRALLCKEAKRIKQAFDLTLPENKKKADLYRLIDQMIGEADKLQVTIQINADTTEITCEYLDRFLPDEGFDADGEVAGYNIKDILSDRK